MPGTLICHPLSNFQSLSMKQELGWGHHAPENLLSPTTIPSFLCGYWGTAPKSSLAHRVHSLTDPSHHSLLSLLYSGFRIFRISEGFEEHRQEMSHGRERAKLSAWEGKLGTKLRVLKLRFKGQRGI